MTGCLHVLMGFPDVDEKEKSKKMIRFGKI